LFYGVSVIRTSELADNDGVIHSGRDLALALLAGGQDSAVIRQGSRVTAYVKRSAVMTPGLLAQCRADGRRLMAEKDSGHAQAS